MTSVEGGCFPKGSCNGVEVITAEEVVSGLK